MIGVVLFFQAEDGIRDLVRSRGLGDVYKRQLFAFVATLLAAVLHTWPLASDPSGLSRHDNADTTLTTWVVSWVAHALPRDPWHVFDAPIFHPVSYTHLTLPTSDLV